MKYCLLLLFLFPTLLWAQTDSSQTFRRLKFFEPAPKFHKARFWGLTSGFAAGYTAVTIGLDRAWYAGYDRGKFHFFDDWMEWRQMDKLGHTMTAYFESKWVGDAYRWAGLSHKEAAWAGFGGGMLFQLTLEMLDGFSDAWGFSWGDFAFNTIGSGLYLGQELLWQEQRIKLKMSTHRPSYSSTPIQSVDVPGQSSSIKNRTANLYGTSVPELFFKEYNGETMWASINIASFCKKKPDWLPVWLNLAVGYGVENVYGARKNSWQEEYADGQFATFIAPPQYRRHSQFFLSFDLDFERIPTKSRGLKFLFGILNIFKVPFPALEINSLGGVHFRPFYF